MADKLLGHWKAGRVEGMHEYMLAAEINYFLRQIVPRLQIYEEISVDGDEWTIHTTSTFKNHKVVFRLGQPFIEKMPDGRVMKTTITIEGNKLVSRQERVKKNEIPSTFTREVTEDGDMLLTCEAVNTVCRRWFIPHNP